MFMFLSLDMVLYIVGWLHYIYVTLSRLIVLYSRCRVNRGTNMSVVVYYIIYVLFRFHCVLGSELCALPNLWGAPHHDVHSVTSDLQECAHGVFFLVEVCLQWDRQRGFRCSCKRLQWGRVPYVVAECLQMWQQKTKVFVYRHGA